MKEIVYLIFAIIPAVVWIYYFRRADKNEPEPVRLLVIAAFVGAAVVLPAAYTELFIAKNILPVLGLTASVSGFLLVNLAIVAVVEEVFKFLAVRFSVYYSECFNEYSDGIIYLVSAALGFAAFENFLYFINFGNEVILIRSLFTPLFHASASAIVGHYLGIVKFSGKYSKRIFFALIFASIIHFIYNLLVFQANLTGNFLFIILAIVLLALSAKWMFDKFQEAEKKDAKCWFCEAGKK